MLESSRKTERIEAMYSLMTSGHHRPRKEIYPDLQSALARNDPSTSEGKMQNDGPDSHDPIVDHLMSSHAFKSIVWVFFVAVIAVSITIVLLNGLDQVYDYRSSVLEYGAGPVAACVPVMAMFVLPCSRRLR
jgi:hypothetical protein